MRAAHCSAVGRPYMLIVAAFHRDDLPLHVDGLPALQILEDVSEEHARKTITVDPHPHLPISAASIHPCRHAEVMKRLVDNLIASGHEFSVNQ